MASKSWEIYLNLRAAFIIYYISMLFNRILSNDGNDLHFPALQLLIVYREQGHRVWLGWLRNCYLIKSVCKQPHVSRGNWRVQHCSYGSFSRSFEPNTTLSPSHLCSLLTCPSFLFLSFCSSVSNMCIMQVHTGLALLSLGSGQRINLSHRFQFSEHLRSSWRFQNHIHILYIHIYSDYIK